VKAERAAKGTPELYGWVADNAHFDLEIVRRPEGAKGFVVVQRRWVAERTFAWLKRCRRLSLDCEKSVLSSEAMIYLAMVHVMLNRLHPKEQNQPFQYRKAS
jgi:transposase